MGLVSSGRVQRRLNSSNSDAKNQQPEQQKKETVHHLTPEEGAEIEEEIKKCDGTPGSPEQEQGSPISEVSRSQFNLSFFTFDLGFSFLFCFLPGFV